MLPDTVDDRCEGTPPGDVDVASVAALLGDRARSAILHALLDGSSRPAGELARYAGVTAATASSHLARLTAADLLRVNSSGRHRYYTLSGPNVAHALEALAVIAPPVPVRSLRMSRRAESMRQARRCYDHLAGRLGVELRDRVVAIGRPERVLRAALERADLPLPAVPARTAAVRDCLDWTERRPHLAGPLAAAVLDALLGTGQILATGDRALRANPQALTWLLGPTAE